MELSSHTLFPPPTVEWLLRKEDPPMQIRITILLADCWNLCAFHSSTEVAWVRRTTGATSDCGAGGGSQGRFPLGNPSTFLLAEPGEDAQLWPVPHWSGFGAHQPLHNPRWLCQKPKAAGASHRLTIQFGGLFLVFSLDILFSVEHPVRVVPRFISCTAR